MQDHHPDSTSISKSEPRWQAQTLTAAQRKAIKMLRKADSDTYFGIAIQEAIRSGKHRELIQTLKEQGSAGAQTLENIIGYEAFQAVMACEYPKDVRA